MTLILTAISKNGICVCADKRYRLKNADGYFSNDDTNYKIYKFKDMPVAILNHGINKLKNKDWKEYCSDYESSMRWRKKDQFQIVNDFKEYIENDVKDELNTHINEQYSIGFLICGKTPTDTKYKVNELFWIINNGQIDFQILRHGNFVRTGDAKLYLDKHLTVNSAINTDNYWKSMKLDRMENEIINLFKIAIQEKKKVNGEDFSNEFDIKRI